ncbi:MAG: tetratricopeptide repeat protein [Rhodospirillaceae bacterium]
MADRADLGAAGPDDPETLFARAAAHYEAGRLADAETLCRRCLAAMPGHAWALNLLGVIHCRSGRGEDGIRLIAQALTLAPDEATFYNNFGTGLTGLGRHADAVTAFRRALELDPASASAHNNIAAPLKAMGKLDEAAEHYQQAVRLRPDFGEGWANLANVLLDMGQVHQAATSAERAIKEVPGYAVAQNNLGTVRHRQGRYADAEACFRRAIELDPNNTDALCNLGEILKESGRAADAMIHYARARDLAPGETSKDSNRLFAMCCLEAADPAEIAAEHKEWGRRARAAATTPPNRSVQDPGRAPGDRLRVGYVSSDFRRHSVAYFLEPILEHHDKNAFEVFAYANMAGGDEVTERLRRYADHWRDVYGLSDAELAARVRLDAIDILIDLNGHTRGNRLLAFARDPAPVQASYLGYPATSGLSDMHGRITDAWADPPGMTEAFHTERLLRLEHGFLCYRPPEDAPAVAPPPSLAAGHVTFGSFNNLAKLTPATIGLWAEILKAVPGARLRSKAKALGDPATLARVREDFRARGIGAERLDLLAWITDANPLAAYHGIDIALDTFPYHGTTTTMEALWMGVPVVTLAGAWHASRVGVSIMARAGLDEMVAANAADYVKIAAALAAKPELLMELRGAIRGMLVRGGITDGVRFTQEFEAALQGLWRDRVAAGA